jgi:hypothetical protein
MGHIEKTVFISYRRTNLPWALAIYQNLTANGYDVFFDYQSINSGDFEQAIIGNIKARAHFLVLLTPTALERCTDPNDWMRREIETALDQKRNIVPLFLEGFDFSNPSHVKYLTGKLEILRKYNGLNVPAGFFPEAMEKLQLRFLNITLDTVLHPISNYAQKVVKVQKKAADRVEPIKQDELTNEKIVNFKSVTLGPDSSYVFFYGRNGYSFRGIPKKLGDRIEEQNDKAVEFISVALGPNESYAFLYNFNGYSIRDVPKELSSVLKEKNADGFEFKSVALGPDSSYVFFYGRNGYSFRGIPKMLGDRIEEQNDKGVEFISVALGPNESYAFLYNFNGYSIRDVPKELSKTMEEKYEQGFEYKSVALGANNSYTFLFGSNGYSYSNVPEGLSNIIKKLRS